MGVSRSVRPPVLDLPRVLLYSQTGPLLHDERGDGPGRDLTD